MKKGCTEIKITNLPNQKLIYLIVLTHLRDVLKRKIILQYLNKKKVVQNILSINLITQNVMTQ